MAGLWLFVLSAGLVEAAGLKVLPGHTIPADVAALKLQPIGNVAATARLHLAIGLPLRNREALTNLLEQIYDPASPNYHHYLTPEQFTEMFGPSEQDYQTVIAFAKANGLTVSGTSSNRLLVDVDAAVPDIERAFHVKMRLYQHPTENRTFYSPDVEPTVSSALPVLDVMGFNNFSVPRPKLQATPLNQVTNVIPHAGSGPAGLYMGYDFRNAYVPGVSLTGSGQQVGLLEFDGFFANDITLYLNQAGLPNIVPTIIPVDGGVSSPGSGNLEVALDIDMAIAMSPGLSKVVVFECPNQIAYWNDILNAMAGHPEIKQLSCSWGGGPPSPSGDQIFQQMAAQGQSFFNASGDSDAFTGAIPFPSESPYSTQVGGTTLSMSGTGGSWSSEKVWNSGGGLGSCGGISPTYSIPSWQQGISMSANQGSTTMRNIPDVALTADNIYIIANNGNQYAVVGTSAAAPLWAGFIAMVNQQAVLSGSPTLGFINPAIYAIAKGSSYAADFHDITTGDNTWAGSPSKFFAVSGYDLCTGLGTPNGLNLIHDLIGKRTGVLQLNVTPPTGSALLQATAQPISVTVNDVFGVTNATVSGVVTNNLGAVIANLSFANNGLGNYSASLPVPAAGNPLTMVIGATAPGEIGITNVLNYSVIVPPANDNFTNATGVPINGASYLANNRFATLETGEPKHNGDKSDAASLWWAWTPTVNTNVLMDTIGSTVENVLAVYTGSTLTSLQSVVGANSILSIYKPARLSFNAQAGTTYYIAVASASSNALGTVGLDVIPGGQPDTNSPVVSVTSPQSGLTVFNPTIGVSGTAADSGPNPSGIYQVFAKVNGSALLNAVGTANWSTVAPLQPGLNVTKVWAVDKAGNFSATNTVQVNYLVVGPPNDFFVNATALGGTSGTVTATNIVATKEVGEPNPAGNPGGKSLWWSYTPPSDGVLTLNTAGSSFDTIMGLYTGTNVANLTTVVDNGDAYSGAPGGFSYISQAVRAGQTYYILVDGNNGSSGGITLVYSFTSTPVSHLTVNISGGGSVQLQTTNPLGGVAVYPTPAGDFANGSTVVLTAMSDHSDQFNSWSGGVNSANNPLSQTIAGDLTVTANFVSRSFTDGFESGDLSHLPWTTAGDAPWFVQSNIVDVGQYAARSGAISDSQSSSLILAATFTNGIGAFDFKVSSEANWDHLNFYVDTNLVAQWSGEIGWANYTFPLTAGAHTLQWTYAKDETISLGVDAAFLDDVDLPIGNVVATIPPRLELQMQPSGGLSMNLTGQSGQKYIIQASSDLAHWQNVSTNTAVGGYISIPLPSNPTNRAQFYRAVAP